jgi:DNA-binding FadR family transcriptional regulator
MLNISIRPHAAPVASHKGNAGKACEHPSRVVSRAAVLADQIETAIVEGEIPADTRLGTKEDLRHRYDVAYGTLNEALRILQQRGYVTSRTGPGGGLFASSPNASLRLSHLILGFREGGTLADCAAVRHALEEPVAVDAARSRSRADVAELETIVDRMAAVAGDPRRYLFENWRLHRRIAAIARNRILGNLYCTLLDATESELQDVVPDPHFAATVEQNLAAHREIVAAIAAGSEERSRRAIAEHEAFFFVPHPDRPVIPPKLTARRAARAAAGLARTSRPARL